MYDSPWKEQFHTLLEDFQKFSKGEIKAVSNQPEKGKAGVNKIYGVPEQDYYKNFWGKLDEFEYRVELETQESPETLVLSILVGHKHHTIIRAENTFDKFMKKIKFSSEFQTENAKFDDALFIDRLTPIDKPLVSDPRFQDMALSLLPFYELRIRREMVEIVIEVDDESIIKYQPLMQRLENMVEIARIIKKMQK